MSLNLCIDWGNTQIKTAIFDEQGNLKASEVYNTNNVAEKLEALIALHNPMAGILCSVADHPKEIESFLKEHMKYFYVLDVHTRLPVMNAYHSPDTLGADRLAMVAGIYGEHPDKNNLVISLGTCITYNLILKNRAFRGGAISPGMLMRFKAMNAFTDKLPEARPEGDLLLLGYDTDTSLRSGVINGMTCEIDGMIEAFKAQYTDFNAVLTGGDAAFFGNKLKNKIFADPDLTLKGLHLILKHNVPQIR